MKRQRDEEKISAWAAYEKGGEIKNFSYEPRPLGDFDIEIKISFCGMCRSDIHQIDSGWGESHYPIVPGHEIIGHVIQKGNSVSLHEIGDRVGVGAQCLSCLSENCTECSGGYEQYCSSATFTYNSVYPDGAISYGGYAKKVRVHESFAFTIPDNLPSEGVAPLFCAGATTFEPLRRFGVAEGHRLGVVGIGGLGHLGILWGVALGAEVTAISRSEAKREISKELGAHDYLVSTNEEQMKKNERSFDFILSTTDESHLTPFVELLKPLGSLIIVGLPEEHIHLKPNPLIRGRSIHGSMLASPDVMKEMLELASENKIVARTKLYPMSEVNQALQDFRDGKPLFRFVLQIPQDD